MIAENQSQFGDHDPRGLKRLSQEVHRIARTLSNLSTQGLGQQLDDIGDMQLDDTDDCSTVPTGVPASSELRKLLRVRRHRDRHFRAELFADPAWDILLDLLAAHLDGEEISISSLCIASAVPPTTALRWIKTMTDEGLLERRCDPLDGRRVFVGLSIAAVERITRYFDDIRRFEGFPI